MESYSSYTCFRWLFPSLSIFSGAILHWDQRARNPTHQGERQLMLDRQSYQALVFPEAARLVQQAS